MKKITIDFQKGEGLVPAILQDDTTGAVLMLGYMNEESLKITNEKKRVTFFSRSKNRLWTKGEESGNYLEVKEILSDCDNDSILIKAIPQGPICHTGSDTCWGENNSTDNFLVKLESVIASKKNSTDEKSYTASLFKSGINKIAQKVGEEAVEVVIEAKDNDDELFLNESADLLFHLMIALRMRKLSFNDNENKYLRYFN